jgi:hypothetical protein
MTIKKSHQIVDDFKNTNILQSILNNFFVLIIEEVEFEEVV